MAIVPIYEFPHEILRKKARKVKKLDKSLDRISQDLVDTMQNAQGVGLAANQIGILKRVIAIQLPEEDPRVYINPEIVDKEGEREVTEACLSVPGYRGTITRSILVKAKAWDRQWRDVLIKAEGLLAQALEHEIDHLNGILYMDHLNQHEKLEKIEPELDQEEVEELN